MHRGARQFTHILAAGICLAVVLLGIGPGGAGAKRDASFEAAAVRREVRRDLPKINRCYESALRYEPALSGKVAVELTVARQGDVRDAEVVQNTTGNEEVGRCVARVVRQIRFQPRKSGKNLLRFMLPFVFALQSR